MSRPDSARSMGLATFLEQSKADHNGFGYETFKLFMESNLSTRSMARAFKVSYNTMVKWKSLYREEEAREDNNVH